MYSDKGCGGECSQGRRPCDCDITAPAPAESCTEIGAEDFREPPMNRGELAAMIAVFGASLLAVSMVLGYAWGLLI